MLRVDPDASVVVFGLTIRESRGSLWSRDSCFSFASSNCWCRCRWAPVEAAVLRGNRGSGG